MSGKPTNQEQTRSQRFFISIPSISTAGRERSVLKSGVYQFTFVLATTVSPVLTKSLKNRFVAIFGRP